MTATVAVLHSDPALPAAPAGYTAALHRVTTGERRHRHKPEYSRTCLALRRTGGQRRGQPGPLLLFAGLSSFVFVRTSACCANLNIGLTCMSQYRERPPSRRGSPHCSPPNMKLVCTVYWLHFRWQAGTGAVPVLGSQSCVTPPHCHQQRAFLLGAPGIIPDSQNTSQIQILHRSKQINTTRHSSLLLETHKEIF